MQETTTSLHLFAHRHHLAAPPAKEFGEAFRKALPVAETARTTDKFVMIPHSVLDCGLTPQALAIYAAMLRHADWVTRETYVSRETLAEAIGTKQPRSADKYVRELVAVGLVTSVQHRWTTKHRDMSDIVFAKDDAHPVQTSNLYTLATVPAVSPQVEPQCAAMHGGSAMQRTGVVRQNAHNPDPFIQNPFNETDQSISVVAGDALSRPADSRKWMNGEETAEPLPLHSEWSPNNACRSVAAELGLDIDSLAAVFAEDARAAGERRRAWGRTFVAYLRDYAEDREHATFPMFAAAGGEDFQDAPASPASILAVVAEPDAEPIPAVAAEPDTVFAEPVQAASVEPIADMFTEPDAAPVVADRLAHNVVACLQWLDLSLPSRLRGKERAHAGAMLGAGSDPETVFAHIVAEREADRARRAWAESELAQVRTRNHAANLAMSA